MESKARYIRVAGTIALVGNMILAAIKLLFAYLSGSMALMGDGVDSSTDVLIAIMTLVVSAFVSRPSDKEHPWGHGRAETTGTMVLSFVICTAGAQLVYQASCRIISGEYSHQTSILAVIAAVISIAGKMVLALTESYLGKKADSEIVKANAVNMKSDIILSAGVLIGLGTAKLFNLPILDPVVAVLVGLWVIKNAVEIFKQMNTELMDGNTDNSLYKKLFDAAISVPGVMNPHRARIRKIASHFDIDLDIEVDPNMTVYYAHEIAEKVEEAIKEEIPDVYDIVVHIEPVGSDKHQSKEGFGLTPNSL